MKILAALLVIHSCVLYTTVSGNGTSVPDAVDDELNPLTAAFLETFTGWLDDSSQDEDVYEEGNNSEYEEENLTEANTTIYASISDEGMVQIEDMILSPDMFEVMYPVVPDQPKNLNGATLHRRAAVSSKKKLWPRGIVPYTYHSNLLGSQAKVRAAMDEWEKFTCIKFVYKKDSQKRYVQIRTKMDKNGKPVHTCSSAVGCGKQRQYVNLAKGCFSHKTILHELGHTLGLVHEHQHPARDKYVTIVWSNINPKKKGNFNLRSKSVSAWGIPYDPTSVMHYRSTSFRKPGCQKPCYTIVSKSGAATTKLIGTAKHLSTKSDIPIINKLYCASTTTNNGNTNNGSTNNNNTNNGSTNNGSTNNGSTNNDSTNNGSINNASTNKAYPKTGDSNSSKEKTL